MLVVRGLDAHVKRHLGRDREAGIELDFGDRDTGESVSQAHQVLIEIRVAAHIDDHDLEIGILLRHDPGQRLLDEGVVLREHGDHHRHRGRLPQPRRSAADPVGGDAPVHEQEVVELHAERGQHHPRKRHPLPAVVRQNRIDESHFGFSLSRRQR